MHEKERNQLIMLFSNIYERFVPARKRPDVDPEASIVFVIDSDQLLVKSEDGEIMFPDLKELDLKLPGSEEPEYLGMIDGRHCFYMLHNPAMAIPEGMTFRNLRAMYGMLGEDIGLVASRAIHLACWSKRNKYCGVCGDVTETDDQELARRCPSCGNMIYPRISPAIIIAVVKENRLLLAHNKNFKEQWYSTVAGFMEPGESIEACAEREVLEEVGVKIKNIRYFASQPWPFPDSLMIGLTAEYESGEITPDGVEIDAADFFRADALPDTPGVTSVAGRLIEWFVEKYKEESPSKTGFEIPERG